MGRPAEPVPLDTGEEILEWLSQGKPLREFCRLDGKPAWRTVYDWMEKDVGFAAAIARARDIGADAIAQEALDILDTEPEVVTVEGGSRRDAAHVAWLKNRFEGRLKLLAKWNPKKYGEKSEVTEDKTVRVIFQNFDAPAPAIEGTFEQAKLERKP